MRNGSASGAQAGGSAPEETAEPAKGAPPPFARSGPGGPEAATAGRARPAGVGNGRSWLSVALLLLAFVLLCVPGLRWDTPTVDEFAHLPAGYYYLRTANFSLYNQNPPLIRVLSALPLLTLNPPPEVDAGARLRNTGWYPWEFGTDFMQRNRARYDLIFLLGRLPIVALGALAGLLVFAWARDLYGEQAGLIALLGYVFCPNIIAHAHLATVDIGHTAFVLLALYSFHRFLRRPGPLTLTACGIALGLAQLTKFTAVLLYPVLLAVTALALARGESLAPFAQRSEPAGQGERSASRGRSKRIGWSLAALAAIFALSVFVLDAGYLFQRVGRPLAAFPFHSHLLRVVTRGLPSWLPIPLPATWLAGFDIIQYINDVGEFPSYLLGRWSREGSIAYYPVAILVKTPLPLLAAWLAMAALGLARLPARLSGRRQLARHAALGGADDRREYLLWLPMGLLLGVFILLSKVDYGIRYILPVLPLALIYTARLVPWVRTQGRAVRAAAALLLACYPLSALLATPNTLSYFNALAAGRGESFLLESNLDWGQGLKRLRAYMDREGLDHISLAYFGHVDPALYGISWQPPDHHRPGLTAVSANFLHGYAYATYAAGRIVPVPAGAFTWLNRYPRVADPGGGIFIYDVR
jgi:4-amino-4-deoxy-L-arabinose transferase-like glycosyltransferase